MNLIALSIPIFLVFIIAEWLISAIIKKPCYRFDDFINNISMGIYQQLFSGVGKLLLLLCYDYLAEHYRLISWQQPTLLNWIYLWLLVDLGYYWLHRATHRINFLWIGHSVHHQSEYYNFSVALRQGVLQGPCTWFFYLPIALLGFSAWMFLIVWQLNTLYQFFIHTTQVKTLGPLEWFLNTPSHHRVHHGQNTQYIDKNYAGSLIIWDKLFGTFEPEKETVRYGVTEPLTRFNPIYANIKVALDTWYYTQGQPLIKRLQAFIMPPEWILVLIGDKQYQRLKPQPNAKRNDTICKYLVINTLLLFVPCISALITTHPPVLHYTLVSIVTLTALSLGSFLDNNDHYFFYDGIRLLLLIFLLKYFNQTVYQLVLLFLILSQLPFISLLHAFSTKVKRSL